jgi:hypothetical protein
MKPGTQCAAARIIRHQGKASLGQPDGVAGTVILQG